MRFRFLDDDLLRLWTDAAYDHGMPPAAVRGFRKVVQVIQAATDERTFYQLKSLHFEKLEGDMLGKRSMRLNQQWRLILNLTEDDEGKLVEIIGVSDHYH